jgi:GlpG protein
MRRPPPLSELGRFPASGGICILALAVTLAELKWDTTPLQMSYLAFWSEPWRLLSSVLPHANAIHLAGNLYWIWVFGTLIELEFGSLHTALLMLVLAIGSSAAEYAFGIGGIGLSGVGYGLFGFLWMASRLQPRLRDAMDPGTTKLFVIWFFFCIFTTWTHVWLIGNVAHGAGAVFGAVAGGLAATKPRIRMTAAMLLTFSLAGVLSAASIWRPLINYDPEAHLDLENAGISAIAYGNNQQAVGQLQAATSYHHAEARTWYNLGVAYQRLNELQKAERAFTKAVELNPSGKSDGGNSLDCLAYIAASRGQHERAIGLYRRAIKAGHSDAESWTSLGTELREIGRDDEAAEAFKHASAETQPSKHDEGPEAPGTTSRSPDDVYLMRSL